MVITISGTTIQIIGDPDIIFQGNNLVNTLAATTDKDDTWEYNIDIYMPTEKRYNSIIMTRNTNMLSVDLTRQMLPYNGRYICQFRGTSVNGAVYHTDKFDIWVKDSIDLNEAYDPMPAEFYQMEAQMKDILKQTQEAAGEALPPISEETNGQYLTNDGTEAKWADVESGMTQETADARYLQLTGGQMSGDIGLDGNKITKVGTITAAGAYDNAGIQFDSNGTIMSFVTGYSKALELTANNVNVVNHGIDNVSEINMTSNRIIDNAAYVGGNTEQNDRTCIDFNTQNAVGIWAEGTERVIIDANGVNVNGNDITGVSDIIADGSTTGGIKFESNGAIVGIICDGTRSATFTANSIDAYEHRISRVGEPLSDTDAARKVDVDTVGNTVNDIIDGTEPLPYLPEDYTPPIATATTVGMIKPGTNFEVTADGTLNYTGSTTSGMTQTEADARYLQLAGGTLSGPLNMGNNKITMGGTPTETTDVTNKGYVDGVVKVVSDEVDGILAGTTPVAIPVATETHVGGIKPGAGTAVSGDGTLTIIVPVPTAEDEGKILVVEGGQYVLKTLTEIQG